MLVLLGHWAFANKAKGLTVCELNEETAELTVIKNYFLNINVGCIYTDCENGLLMMTDERDGLRGTDGGSGYVVTARGNSDGQFELISEAPSMGCAPAYVSPSADGRYILVANHGQRKNHATRIVKKPDGSFDIQVAYDQAPLALFESDGNGSIGELKDIWVERDEWSSPDFKPHLHYVSNNRGGSIYFVTDPGTDSIFTFAIDEEKGRLQLKDKRTVEKGKMPRYIVFNPEKDYFYANNERDGMINIFRYDADGMMERTGSVSQLFTDSNEHTEPSDLKISPVAPYIYGAVRGENVLTVLKVNDDGSLTLLQNTDCGGIGPRGICVSPDGKFLVCANQHSSNVAVFSIGEDGLLTLKTTMETHDPGCLAFWN